ncbi:unnamed protein product [Brassica rapa]|uniref:Uncharacterized protein n=1 Tax=Brassica campestris TaxID=3711 RepID=A0A3P5YKA5_BRACM|nr:unnamed protein product [Brassica rapa]VDC68096.1 unnamed protein product [Brassica rapa]
MERTKSNTTQAVKQYKSKMGSDLTTRKLDEKPISCRELPREGRPQTLIVIVPTASNRNPERIRAKNPNANPIASGKEETTGSTRRSQKPKMSSFSGLCWRLPPPLPSTRTVYTHLTATLINQKFSVM